MYSLFFAGRGDIFCGNYAAAHAQVDELIALADEKGVTVLESTWNRLAGLSFLH